MSASEQETEAVIYAEIGDFAGLEECDSKEEHLQYEGSFSNGIKCRVRRVTAQGREIKYYFTYKVPGSHSAVGVESNVEHTVAVDESFFMGFKSVAERTLDKTRYNFPSKSVKMAVSIQGAKQDVELPNVMYEVDVYRDHDGKPIAWCKIDVEIDSIAHYLENQLPFKISSYTLNISTSHLPFKPKQTIIQASATPEELKMIDMLWSDHYVLKKEVT